MTLEFQPVSEIGKLLLGSPFSGQIDDILSVDSKLSDDKRIVRIYVRHGANLVALNVSTSRGNLTSRNNSSEWTLLWNHQIFKDSQRTSYPLRTYPWLVTDTMLDDGSDGIVLRNEDGLGFYRFDPKDINKNKTSTQSGPLQGLTSDTNFRDLYEWNDPDRFVLLIGRFYRNTRIVGVMSRQKKEKESETAVQFYAAAKDRLASRKPHPLFPLQKSKTSTDIIARISGAIDLYKADIKRSGQDSIILRTENQLEMYTFDENFALLQMAKVSLVDGSWTPELNERFFFVDLTGQPYLDVVQFNRHGMFVYQRNNKTISATAIEDYNFVHYHAGFTENYGWISEYNDSIRLVDTNGDGRDDLLFTGPKGLTVLGFDPVALIWKTLLDPSSQIAAPHRFATVVGATRSVTSVSNKESILLTIDENKRLFMGKLLVKKVQPPPPKSSNKKNVTKKAPTAKKTVPPQVKIPSQVKRTTPVLEKPLMRWTEQWAEPVSIPDVVDPISGSVHFPLPIFEPSHSDPVPHRISLSYHSQKSSISNLVGLGWTVSLPENYIMVDYQGSVFLEDATFYLMMDGMSLQLKPLIPEGQQVADGVQLFLEPLQPKWKIEFHQTEQRWTVGTETDILIFGSTGKGTEEAVRWNLNWPLWRGPGNDPKSLKRVPVAWYLLKRQVKATGRSIIYHYEIDSVDYKNSNPISSWTAAIRLKQISVESATTIIFDYDSKENKEYKLFDHPFDSRNNQSTSLVFPVSLRESHYLTGCDIETEDYKLKLEFKYETEEKGGRLLTGIEQPIHGELRESIFQFSYHEEDPLVKGRLLKEIRLARGLKAEFQYDSVADIDLPDPYPSVAHPVDESPAVDYSHDYAAMVFRQRQLPNKIQVKILNVDSLETFAELSPIPAETPAEGKVSSYVVRSYVDFCVVILESDKGKKRQICLFHHSSEKGVKKWNKDPTCYWFSHDAQIHSTDAGIAVINGGSDVVQIFELSHNLSKWIEHRLKLPSGKEVPVIRFEMVGHLIVGYDDRRLFICHPDGSKRKWQMRIVEEFPGLLSGGSAIVKKFRLPSDPEKMLIDLLKTDLLQLSSNLIAICSLHLSNQQQLLLKIRLFLFDASYNVARRREFTVKGEEILKLRRDVDNGEGTSFKLGYYVTNSGSFRLKVVDVSGKLLSDVRKKSRSSPKMADILKEINALKDFQKLFDESFIVTWSVHRTLLTQEGIHAGNGTFIRMTGDDWQLQETKKTGSSSKESSKSAQNIIPLGKSYVLEEPVADDKEVKSETIKILTLYAQDQMKLNQKTGPLLHRLEISPQDQAINRYPLYLAYGNRDNSTKVVLFSEEGLKFGNVQTFPNEQLLSESSSYERLTTLARKSNQDTSTPEKMKFLSRSLRSMNPNLYKLIKRSAVKRVKLSNTDASLTRMTGYQWENNAKGNVTVTTIPGNDRKLAGWLQQTWTNDGGPSSGWDRAGSEMFDADGNLVKNQSKSESKSDDESKTSDSILWNNKKRLIVSDFSPYNISDQMVSYYGFESYEINNSSYPSHWRFFQPNIMKKGFALTGANFLRLNGDQSLLEGTFLPTNQQGTYLTSCWVRPSDGVASTTELDNVTAHLKATVSVEETQEEIVGLLGRIMRKVGDWSYIELLIDFNVVKRLFMESNVTEHHENRKNTTIPQFTITIKVDARQDGRTAGLDVDHVRFTPMVHDFKATVYDSDNGRPVSVIGSSGSISRTVCYHGREMAIITDVTVSGQQQLEQVATSSYTGRLIPTPKGSSPIVSGTPPSRTVFYPENGGLYETFDAYAWRNRWKDSSANSTEAWTVAPGRLWHNHQQAHQLDSVDPSAIFGAESSSAAVRCYYSLISPTSSIIWKLASGQVEITRKSEESSSTLTLVQPDAKKSRTTVTNLPNSSEFIMMTEGSRLFIWIDSVLLLDLPVSSPSAAYPWSSFAFEAQGNSFVEDCVFMGNPRAEIEYLNEWGEKMQTVQLETDRSALVSHTLYDALGRSAIKTKMTRIMLDEKKPGALLSYYSDFVSGPIDPANPLSVWQTHHLQGEVDRLNPLDGGVPYSRTEYEANPLNEKRLEGQPGLNYTVNGRYAKKFRTWVSDKEKIDVVENHFPTNKGFRHKMEEMPNGTKKVAVMDSQDNRVALYVYVPGYNHILSTYEYNSKNQLIKILPPIYHDRADTFMKSGPLWPMTKTEMNGQQLTPDEVYWQKTLGTHMTYDGAGRVIRKTTPDTGTFEYYYNRAGQVRLQVHFSSEESDEIDIVIFYEYDNGERAVSRTGFLEEMPMSREKFQKALADGTLTKAKDYQLIDRTEAEARHYDTSLSRGERNATFVTHNFEYNIVEEMRWDGQDRLLESKRIVSDEQFDSEVLRTYYSYSNRLRSIQYPSVNGDKNLAIKLEHHYNKLGQLTSLSLDGQPGDIVRFSYHGSGTLANEYILPGSQHGFNRTFNYNSPGFLERVTDPYLTELVSYTDGGYGRGGSGDGIVTRTTFNATWSPNADWRWFQVSDNSKMVLNSSSSSAEVCLKALKRNGYMTNTGRPLKDYYYPLMDKQNKLWMPLICGGRNGQQLAKVLAQKRMPRIYGHRYAYGNHQELVKAKYFTEETEKVAVPFQPDTLAELTALSKQQSRDIWKKLEDARFILTDQRVSDWLTAVANPGIKPLVKSNELNTRLVAVDTNSTHSDVTPYRNLIEQMILNDIGQQRDSVQKLEDFQKIFVQWKGVDDGLLADTDNLRKIAEAVHHNVLGQVKDNSAWLDEKLIQIFRPVQYSKYLTEFIRIVSQHFTYNLGQHPFDVASYEIDANGNHRKFYTGFHRYEFSYGEDKANQIRSVKVEGPGQLDGKEAKKVMLHDTRGNVIQALHKGIERIEYNSASMRTTAVYMKDGKTVRFAYDAHGERIQKRVTTKDGSLIQEIHYVRDTEGKVLFDRRTTYSSTNSSILPELKDAASVIVSTAYIYGPRGLLGFIRNGAFHSVWTDHSGSIRLVLKDGQVVAAYDYLPYGQLMRSYGSDPAAEIFYRYTGQEWDEETGLYNYHARLYDPDIGRFYQPDPREQYFSPYKYVGNSPVSLVDPDGEFGLLALAAVGALALGYLGGASANRSWNPRRWNWRSKKTWLGIAGGAFTGAMIPFTAAAAVASFGIAKTVAVAATGAYVTTAAGNNNWNVAKWNWKDPSTYNALFQGAATGLSIVGGVASAHSFANTFGSVGKKLLLTATYGAGGGMAYAKGMSENDGKWAPWKWDWKNPGTYNALMEGVDSGISWPTDLTDLGMGLYKMAKKTPKSLGAILPMLDNFKLKQLKPALASIANGPIGQAATMALSAYLMMSSADEDFQPSGWDSSSLATYESFLNGLSFSKTARNMLKVSTRQPTQFYADNSKYSEQLKPTIEKMRIIIGRAFDDIRKDIFQSSSVNLQGSVKHKLKTRPLVLPKDGLGLQFSTHHQQSTKKPAQELSKTPAASHRLVAMEDVKNRIKNRQNEVFTDREIGTSGCRSGLGNRRPKRETIATVCRVPVPDTGKLSQLKEDPVNLLTETAISTFFLKGSIHKDESAAGFELVHADGPGYYLKVSKDPSAVRGYWLNSEDKQNGGKIRIDPMGDIRFIFTSEMQGASIYIKYDKTKSEMEVYHHNRKSPSAIYLNNNPKTTLKIKRTTDRGGDYVNEFGQTIPELAGVKELFNAKGKLIEPVGGVIIPLDNIYRKDSKSALQMVKELKGKRMEDLIKENKAIKEKEDLLAKEYDSIITQKDYLGFPFNWPLLISNKQYPRISATLLLYRDDYFKWHVISQKIQYPSDTSTGLAKEQFKIPFLLEGLTSLPFPIGSLTYNKTLENVGTPISPTVEIKPSLQDRIKTTADIRDLDMENKNRSRRSAFLGKGNTTYPYDCQLTNKDDVKYSNQSDDTYQSVSNMASSASRPSSWIDLLSSFTGRQVLSSMASAALFDSVFEFIKVSHHIPGDRTENSHNQFQQESTVELTSELYSGRKDYRDITIGNCYSFTLDADRVDDTIVHDTIVCYGHRGQTKVFSHSPSYETCPPPIKKIQDTYRDCRPIEWYGQPTVSCRGDETTFIHIPYNTNSAAAYFFGAVDSWLILAHVTPGFYRETVKFVKHVKNAWTSPRRISSIPIGNEDKESWKKQLALLEQKISEKQSHQISWVSPLIEELRQQICALCNKNKAETMDDVRAVKTMTERLIALTEDVEEIADLHIEEDDEEEVFYDCIEEFPSADWPEFDEVKNNAESISTRLHHLVFQAKTLFLYNGNKVSTGF